MAERRGPGRWCTVRKPRGVLWESSTGTGFDPVPGETDTTILDLITAGAQFDTLAATHGERITEGDLDHWTPTRKTRR